jgi:DNA-binding NtrC family response regulator
MRQGLRVLVAEDDAVIGLAVEAVLAEYGCSVLLAGGVDNALKIADPIDTVDLAIVDMQLADGSGTRLVERLRAHRPALPVIISTGYALSDADRAALASTSVATLVLEKPWSEAELVGAMEAATEPSRVAELRSS